MAEGLLRRALGEDMGVASAGLEALVGREADGEARRLAESLGLDLAAHRGRQLTPEMLLDSDLTLVMESRQAAACARLATSVHGRVFLLGHWRPTGEQEIPDPFHRGQAFYRRVLDQISICVADWVPRIRSGS